MDSIFRDKIIRYLKKNLPPERFRHTLGARKVALELAKIYGVDPEAAETAALLHDCAKGLSARSLVAYTRRHKLSVPVKNEIVKFNPKMLHGFVSADIAKNIFKVRDKNILNSITYHTTGDPGMGVLEKIIYVSDITSPERRFPGVDKIRALSFKDLEQAYKLALKIKIEHVLSGEKWIHPNSVYAWNALIR
jgi:predicted HD superfamily hydrolase involved in NAD metabolism